MRAEVREAEMCAASEDFRPGGEGLRERKKFRELTKEKSGK